MPMLQSSSEPFLAVGVISAPEYVHRRAVLRHTWLGLSAPSSLVTTSFVVRTAHAPAWLRLQLRTEVQQHNDLVQLESVAWNETRLRGPVLTLAGWLRHAFTHLSGARFVAKVDDDSYLHAPALALMLQSIEPQLRNPMVYIGTMTWYSWFAKHWDRCGFGWTWRGSENVGHLCRNASWSSSRCGDGCGESVGPFPFAAGYLIVLSAPLVGAVASSPALNDETLRLSRSHRMVTHKGFVHTQVFEDVWLGSFLHRFLSSTPIAFLNLFRSETVVDLDQTQWGSTVRPSAYLVHIRSKETRIFLAVHDFLNSSAYCRSRPVHLSCREGCEAFGVPVATAASRMCASISAGNGAARVSSLCTLKRARPLSTATGAPEQSSKLSFKDADLCEPVNLKPRVWAAETRARAHAIGLAVRQQSDLHTATVTALPSGASNRHKVGNGKSNARWGGGGKGGSGKGRGSMRGKGIRGRSHGGLGRGEYRAGAWSTQSAPVAESTPARAARLDGDGRSLRAGRGAWRETHQRWHKTDGSGPDAMAKDIRDGAGWHSEDGALTGLLHLAQLRADGSLDIPFDRKIVLEVGANTRNTLDRELLPLDPSTFLLSFEPLLDKWAALLARNSRPDQRTPLGHHHPRGIALPFAVSSEHNSVREFKISGRTDGCASLLSPVSSYYSQDCINTSGILERRRVPSVSLEKILGSWLRGRDIALAKVDAQGLDVGVVRSAGAHISRLKAVQLEVVRDRPPLKCTPQYAAEAGRASEAKCGALVASMAQLGFEPYATNCLVHKFKEAGGCEAEMMFVQPGFDEQLVRTFCMSQRPHSCGPGAWSFPSDRASWSADMHAWAAAEEKKWPSVQSTGISGRKPLGRIGRRKARGQKMRD